MHSNDPSDNGPGTPVLDAASAELLVRRVRAAVRRSCPPWLASQSEDIAQEVLLQLFRKLRRGEGEDGFSTIYLLKAAHGVTVDEIRRRSRRREQTGREDEMVEVPRNQPDPEQTAHGHSVGREIRRCLEMIVPARRIAVVLRLLGCSVPEIARRLGCPPKSADNRLYRGMKNLRDCLQTRGITP